MKEVGLTARILLVVLDVSQTLRYSAHSYVRGPPIFCNMNSGRVDLFRVILLRLWGCMHG